MEPIIKVTGLSQTMGRKIIFNDLQLEVFPGEIFGIFGTRATGKTTLLHILAGLDRYKAGTVTLFGQNIARSSAYKNKLGLVTQERSLFQDLKVAENLDFIATLKGAPRKNIFPLMERLVLEEFLKEPVKSLDAGVYQRLSLACALLNDPELLIVDELINDVDLPSRRLLFLEIKRFINNGGTCVCGFSNPNYFSQPDRIGWLEGDQINIYTPAEAVTKWEDLFIQTITPQSGEKDA